MKNQFANLGKVTKGATKTTGVSPFSDILIALIYPNPHQPRKEFANIEELATSIEANGLISPITVVKREKRYMIVAGERRYRAMQSLGKKLIKCNIVEKSDAEIEEIALVENINREDLSDFEIAVYVNAMLHSCRYKDQNELAKKIGKSPSYISKCKKVLNLPDYIKENIDNPNSTKVWGIELLSELCRVEDKDEQIWLFDNEATVKEIRERIQEKKDMIKQSKLDAKEYMPKKERDGSPVASMLNKYYPCEDETKIVSSTKKRKVVYSFMGVASPTTTFGTLYINEELEGENNLRLGHKLLKKDKKYKITIEEVL
ncbi:MAG: ParB/RepB/Spo0J family partition protein [Sulfurovum sp.]